MAPARRRVGRLLAALAICSALGLTGCEQISALGADHIGDLLQNPTAYQGKTVKLAGEVTNAVQIPLVGTRLYTVRDKTGEIAVVTYGDLPPVGRHVVVRGMFSTVATFGLRSVGPHVTVSR